jgi:hypothetical protein
MSDLVGLLTGIEIVAAILAYGAYEYFMRERRHREALAYLKRGEKPPVRAVKVELWKLFTTGGMVLVLLAAIGVLTYLAFRTTPHYASPIYLITFVVIMITLMVLTIFMRDVRTYRRSAGKET